MQIDQPATPVHIDAASTYRPGHTCDLAADERFIPGIADAESDVGLALGQIKTSVAHHELAPQTRMACMKGVDERCPSEASCHARSAGHTNSKAVVTRCEVTFK